MGESPELYQVLSCLHAVVCPGPEYHIFDLWCDISCFFFSYHYTKATVVVYPQDTLVTCLGMLAALFLIL